MKDESWVWAPASTLTAVRANPAEGHRGGRVRVRVRRGRGQGKEQVIWWW